MLPDQKMTFHTEKLHSGWLTYGQPTEWEWTRNGGSYSRKRDFFRVHWEVHHPEENPELAESVRLHVESPDHATDPELNAIKQQIVGALLESRLKSVAEANSLGYKTGKYISLENIRRNRCTEALRVIVSEEHRHNTPQQNIERIHARLGAEVELVLHPFFSTLNRQFESRRA